MPLISVLERWTEEDHRFQACLGYIGKEKKGENNELVVQETTKLEDIMQSERN